MQSLLIRTDLNNLSRSNVIRCFDVPSIIINDEKKSYKVSKLLKVCLILCKGADTKASRKTSLIALIAMV